MTYVHTQEEYDDLFEQWNEIHWALNDMYFCELILSEDGSTLIWNDDYGDIVQGPIELSRIAAEPKNQRD